MARSLTSVESYFAAKRTRSYEKVYKASKVEAARMYTELSRWKEWQERYDPEGMLDIYEEAGIFDKIEESRRAVGAIREKTRTRKKHALARNVAAQQYTEAVTEEDKAKYKAEYLEAVERVNGVEDEQFGLLGRVTRNYCLIAETVLSLGGGNPEAPDAERDPFEEYEYAPGA